MTLAQLEKFRALAVGLSAIAVPILVAVFGWRVQATISEAGLRKDYVQIAVGVLQSPPSEGNSSLRAWSVAMLDKNSPVPFSSDVRRELEDGSLVFQGLSGLVKENCPELTALKDDTFGATVMKLLDVIQQYQRCRIAAMAGAGLEFNPKSMPTHEPNELP